MLQKTRGIVLRSVKYGETSIVCTIFTDTYGVQSYMMQGVRSSKSKTNRSGLLQPASLLDMVAYHKPNTNLQRIKEFQPLYLYKSIQEHIVKNSIALFSAELLLRILPAEAPAPELFEECIQYFMKLDELPANKCGNLPLYIALQCCNMLGYNVTGEYSDTTPHLNLQEGGFTPNPPTRQPFMREDDARLISLIININSLHAISEIPMNADTRFRLLDWFIAYIHSHTQHMGEIRCLPVLRAILH